MDWASGVLSTLDGPAFYRSMARLGIRYGPDFRMLLKKTTDGSAAVLRCQMAFVRVAASLQCSLGLLRHTDNAHGRAKQNRLAKPEGGKSMGWLNEGKICAAPFDMMTFAGAYEQVGCMLHSPPGWPDPGGCFRCHWLAAASADRHPSAGHCRPLSLHHDWIGG